MKVLTAEQVEYVAKILLKEVQSDADMFDLLVEYTTPEWRDMDKDERDCYFYGFLNGYKSCLEIHKHILKTRR